LNLLLSVKFEFTYGYSICKNTRMKQNNNVLYRIKILFMAILLITEVKLVLHIIILTILRSIYLNYKLNM